MCWVIPIFHYIYLLQRYGSLLNTVNCSSFCLIPILLQTLLLTVNIELPSRTIKIFSLPSPLWALLTFPSIIIFIFSIHLQTIVPSNITWHNGNKWLCFVYKLKNDANSRKDGDFKNPLVIVFFMGMISHYIFTSPAHSRRRLYSACTLWLGKNLGGHFGRAYHRGMLEYKMLYVNTENFCRKSP